MRMDYIILLLIIMLSIKCIVCDLRDGRIPNQYLFRFGLFIVGMNIVFSVIYKPVELGLYLFSLSGSLVLSFVLFAIKFWAGGDCKMYSVIICSLPWTIVVKSFHTISVLLWIPILAFLIGYFFLIGVSIFSSVKDYIENGLIFRNGEEKWGRKFISFCYRYLSLYFALSFVNHIAYRFVGYTGVSILLQNEFPLLYDSIWIRVFVFLFDLGVVMFLQKWNILDSYVIVIALFVSDLFLGILSIGMILEKWTFLTWGAICLTWILRELTNRYVYEEITPGELKEGMILSTACSFLLANGSRSKQIRISDESLGSRLTEQEVRAIKEICNKNSSIGFLSIVKKVPFAAFIGMATVIVSMVAII